MTDDVMACSWRDGAGTGCILFTDSKRDGINRRMARRTSFCCERQRFFPLETTRSELPCKRCGDLPSRGAPHDMDWGEQIGLHHKRHLRDQQASFFGAHGNVKRFAF